MQAQPPRAGGEKRGRGQPTPPPAPCHSHLLTISVEKEKTTPRRRPKLIEEEGITGGVQKNTARGNIHPSRDGTSRRRLDQTCKTQTVQKEGALPAKRQPAAPKNRNKGSREKRRPAKKPRAVAADGAQRHESAPPRQHTRPTRPSEKRGGVGAPRRCVPPVLMRTALAREQK